MSSRALVVHPTTKQKGRDQLRNAFCGRFFSHKKNFCFYQHDSARCFHGDVKKRNNFLKDNEILVKPPAWSNELNELALS